MGTFSERLKELRKNNNLTQSELCKKIIKITDEVEYVQTISYWENGREANHASLIALAEIFGVTVDYLVGIDTPSTERPLTEEEAFKAILFIQKFYRDDLSERELIIGVDEAWFVEVEEKREYIDVWSAL